MTDKYVELSEKVDYDEEPIEHDSNLDTSILYNNVEDQITSKTESYDEDGVAIVLTSRHLACEN